MNDASRTRVLLIGPLPRADGPIGGTQVSFDALLRDLGARSSLDVQVIDTSRSTQRANGWRRGLDTARLFARTLALARERIPDCDVVMLNASSGAMLRAGPFIAAAARWASKPFIARCFGGNLDLAIDRAGRIEGALAMRMFANADLVLLQTRALCERFAPLARVRWLPTTRAPVLAARVREGPARKFLFLSQLRPEKGYGEALAAIEQTPPSCSLTLCGPRMPGTDIAGLADHPRAAWIGPLAQARVPQLLAEHDAFVFPSYYDGEGLPGAVIEALQAGMPVIAADWRSIRDLIEHDLNGLLVPARDANALAGAMRTLASDPRAMRRLSRGALRTGAAFDARPVLAQVESWLHALARGRTLPAIESAASLTRERVLEAVE